MRSVFVALGLLLLGCSTTAGQLKTRFAKERACPEDEVRVSEKGGNAYVARGCGQSAEYVCSAFANSQGTAPCEERGLRRQAPAGGDPRPFPESPTTPQAPPH
jgi:hypothetical protein